MRSASCRLVRPSILLVLAAAIVSLATVLATPEVALASGQPTVVNPDWASMSYGRLTHDHPGSVADDGLGRAVAIDGNTAVVGARDADYWIDDWGWKILHEDCGLAYVYEWDGAVWNRTAQLVASDPAADDGFGSTVAISGDTIVIGAPMDDAEGTDSGSVYVFTRSGGVWTQTHKVTDPRSAWDPDSRFGSAVALDGDHLVVGAPYADEGGKTCNGVIAPFTITAGVATPLHTSGLPAGASDNDWFGYSVDTAWVTGDKRVYWAGSPTSDVKDSNAGKIEQIYGTAFSWTRIAKYAPDFTSGGMFGRSLDFADGHLVVGAQSTSDHSGGRAYVYGISWYYYCDLEAELAPVGTSVSNYFGLKVAIDGDMVAVGDYSESTHGTNAGAVWTFRLNDGEWGNQIPHWMVSPAAGDAYGSSVDVSDGRVIGGAPGHTVLADSSGAAHVFSPLQVAEDTQLAVPNPGLKGNDWDPEGDPFTWGFVQSPRHGVVNSDWSNGWFYYMPESDFNGTEAFSYLTWDGTNVSATVGATIEVMPVEDPPTAIEDSLLGEIARFTASDEQNDDYFGYAVDVSGNTLIVGANSDDGRAESGGAAYVFVRSNGRWVEQAKLVDPFSYDYDFAGHDVAIDGDTAMLSIPRDDTKGFDAGSVLVFDRVDGVWNLSQTLTAPDGAANDQFGFSVDLEGDTAVVGSVYDDDLGTDSGSAYVFTRSAGVWSYRVRLAPSALAAGDFFGKSIAIDGETLVVGANGDDGPAGTDSGRAYVFTGSGASWTQQAVLEDSAASASDYFGHMVAISGDTIAVCIPRDDEKGTDSGSVLTFERSGSAWTQGQRVTLPAGAAYDNFGWSVGIDGDTLVSGAVLDDPRGTDSGSAHVFRRSGGTWAHALEYAPSGVDGGDRLGQAVAVSDGWAVVSASAAGSTGLGSGGVAFLLDVNEYTTPEDNTLNVAAPGVLRNDYEPDGDAITASVTSQPAHGMVALAADGSFEYTPAWDFSGTDTFKYRTYDGKTYSAATTVTIEVSAAVGKPTAVADSYGTSEDTTLSASGLLSNDTDNEGDSLTAKLHVAAVHGDVTVAADGSFEYAPDPNWFGTDTFQYVAFDGQAYSDPAVVTITVDPVNDVPVATHDLLFGDMLYGSAELVSDDAAASDRFANSVDSDGLTLVAGAPGESGKGAAYIFEWNGTTWVQQAKLVAADGEADDDFGAAVSVSGDTVLVGAPGDDDRGSGAGAAYVFVRQGAGWIQQAKLTDSYSRAGDGFGTAVAVSGDRAIVGAPAADYEFRPSVWYYNSGSARTYLRSGSTWLLRVLHRPTATSQDSYFGSAVDIDGAVAVAGAYGLDSGAGKAYVLNDALNTLGSTALSSPTPASGEMFGRSVAISGDQVLIGAPAEGGTGRAYCYNGSYLVALVAAGLGAGDYYGGDVAILGDRAIIGAHNDDDAGSNSGAAYTFKRTTSWTYCDKLVDDSSVASDGLGGAVAVTGVGFVAGGPNKDAASVNSGALAFAAAAYPEDTPVTLIAPGVKSNDSDVETSISLLTASLVSTPAHGNVNLGTNGSLTYTPQANYHGPDSFTYRIFDGQDYSDPATVRVNFASVEDVPLAVNDSASCPEDGSAQLDVLANDSDGDGDALTASLVAQPPHGTVTLAADGTGTYAPDPDWSGIDSFQYTVTDGKNTPRTATVNITVSAVNDAPVAVADSYSATEDVEIYASTLRNNDTDVDNNYWELTTTLVQDAEHGSLNLMTNGSFTYRGDTHFNGTDTFVYRVTDPGGLSSTATVTLTVQAVNDPPWASNDNYSTDEDTALDVSAPGVLANDSDVDGDSLTASLRTDVSHGTLSLAADGSFDYTPDPGYHGSDSFQYRATDPGGLYSDNWVGITVTSVEDVPVAAADSYSTDEDTPLTVPAAGVLANDSDGDGDALTSTLATDVSHGTLTLNANGSFDYTPDADWHGTDSFTYKAADPDGDQDQATVTITVDSVEDAPHATNDSVTLDEDTSVVFYVLTNDSDADGDTLTAAKLTDASHGTVTLDADGRGTYSPTGDYFGPDSFTYSVSDGKSAPQIGTVDISVANVNDAPVAAPDPALFSRADVVRASDAADSDRFGRSVAVSGDLMIASAALDDHSGQSDPGSVYAYRRAADGGWVEEAKLTDPTPATNDWFGSSVALQGNTAVVGTMHEDGARGAVYVFVRDAQGLWTQQARLVAIDRDPNDRLGQAVRIDGDTIVAGAFFDTEKGNQAGAAYVFVRSGDSWSQQAKLTASDGAATDWFGHSVGISGDTVIVGAPWADSAAANAGAAYVYTRSGATWSQVKKLTHATASLSDWFGWSVAIDSGTAVVGAKLEDVAGGDSGAVYVFEGAGSSWSQAAVLAGESAALGGGFGESVAIDSGTIVVGAVVADTDVVDSGAGYVFEHIDGAWTQIRKLPASGAPGGIGNSVAVDAGTVALGSKGEDGASTDEGCVYTFTSDFATAEDTLLTVAAPGLLENDSDVEGDTLTSEFAPGGDAAHGTVTINTDGSFTYTPDADWSGIDSFTYRAFDGEAYSNEIVVPICVASVNDVPDAPADSYSAIRTDTQLLSDSPGVLVGIADIEGSVAARVVAQPQHGTLSLAADGSYTYTPDPGFTGFDEFTYEAFDGIDASAAGKTTVFVYPAQGEVEEDDSRISYGGSWVDAPGLGFTAGHLRVTADPEAAARATFTGKGAELTFLTGPNYGIASVTVDGGEPVLVDLYTPDWGYRKPLWLSGALADGPHTIEIAATNTKNPASTSTRINIDCFRVAGDVAPAALFPHLCEQDDAMIAFSKAPTGGWATATGASFTNRKLTYSVDASAALSAVFDGTRAGIVALTGPTYGIANVSIDGGAPVQVDLYSPAYAFEQMVFDSGELAPGTHTIDIWCSGDKRPESPSARINLDALSITGELLQASALDTRFDQNDPRITYYGTFATANSPSFTGGSLAYSTSAEATISLAFDGTAFELVALTGPNYGIANVSVDGAAPFPVDLYTAGWFFGQKVFALEGLPPGPHALTISRSGTRNPSALGDRINLDAVWVRGALQ